jgi:hypothetical protein
MLGVQFRANCWLITKLHRPLLKLPSLGHFPCLTFERPRYLGLFSFPCADCRWMGVFARAVDTHLWAAKCPDFETPV